MGTRRILALASVAAGVVTAAVLIVPSLGAQTPNDALANFTPGAVKLLHTGGTVASSGYADVDRLTIPAGSYMLTAHAVIDPMHAHAASDVNCFLVYPGTKDDLEALPPNVLGATSSTNSVETSIQVSPVTLNGMQNLSADAVTTTATGGNVDFLCRVSNAADDRTMYAEHASIVALPVSGTTVTANEPPAEGQY